MSDLIESMFGGDGSSDSKGESIPMWAKIIIILVFIIFVLPVIIIAVPMLALALVALVYGEPSGASSGDGAASNIPAPVKDGAAIVKDTFSVSW